MKEKIIENGIEYVRDGDYYVPNLFFNHFIIK